MHYPLVLGAFFVGMTDIRLDAARRLVHAILALMLVILMSALFNNAGPGNVVLDIALLLEPFMLLAIIVMRPMTVRERESVVWILMLITILNTLMVYYQYIVIHPSNLDDVKGIYLLSRSGHHVSGAVGLASAVFVYTYFTSWPLSRRLFAVAVLLMVPVFTDTKQVIAAYLPAFAVMMLMTTRNIWHLLKYVFASVFIVALLVGAAYTIFPALTSWMDMRQDLWGLHLKLSIYDLVVSHYDGIQQWLFGLGPGHGTGRLAQVAPEYPIVYDYGITYRGLTNEVFEFQQNYWETHSVTGSSMFALTFSWAAVWGELGLVGLGAYLYIFWVTWKDFCLESASKFLLITVVVLGGIFSWLEEPQFMCFIAALIGVYYQKVISTESTEVGELAVEGIAPEHAG